MFSKKRAATSPPQNVNSAKDPKLCSNDAESEVINLDGEHDEVNVHPSVTDPPLHTIATDGPPHPSVDSSEFSPKRIILPDLGNFVNNQVSSPSTGTVTFNFSHNIINRRQSLNL